MPWLFLVRQQIRQIFVKGNGYDAIAYNGESEIKIYIVKFMSAP